MSEAMMSTESLPFEETADTGISPDTGSDDSSSSWAEGDTQVADSSEQEPNPGDFESRLREGGDFAVEQTKNFQRKFGQATSRVKELEGQVASLEPLLPVVQQLGGAQGVIQNLERLGRMYGDPQFRQVIEQFERTGTFKGTNDEDEQYVDPIEAELRKEIQSLRSEVTDLRGSTLRNDGALAQQRFRGHFAKVLKEYPFTPEERERIDKGVEVTLASWTRTPEGIRTIESLDEKTARNLIVNQLSPDEQEALYLRRARARHEEKRRFATDARPSTATGKAASSAKSVLDAYREACVEVGLNPDGRLV